MVNARRVTLSRKSSPATGIFTKSISRTVATKASLFPASNAAEKESFNCCIYLKRKWRLLGWVVAIGIIIYSVLRLIVLNMVYSISSSIISLISCVPGFDALVSTSLPNLSVNKVLRVKIQINFFVSFTSPQKLNFVWQALLTSYNKPRKHDTLLKHYYYSLFSWFSVLWTFWRPHSVEHASIYSLPSFA